MTKDEALKMAIEALSQDEGWFEPEKAIQACKEALEQPTMTYEDGFAHGYEAHKAEQALEQPAQEPVAWIIQTQKIDGEPTEPYAMMGKYKYVADTCDFGEPIPLYTHPAPSWQGLSDDEIGVLFDSVMANDTESTEFFGIDFARAIEQALKEKNGKV
jgi:hypothetical protein